jgi:ABC-type ATPase involved in cell division
MSAIVELSRVSKSYLAPTRILDAVDLSVARGEFLYLVGGSGAGKSSLLRLITMEDRPTEGSVKLFGFDLATASDSALQAIRRSIGYVPQEIQLIGDLTVEENIELSLSLAGEKATLPQMRARVREVLEKVGLEPKRGQRASTLSGGESQRVAIARALVRQPQLIVADEPTGAQDRERAWAVMNLLVAAHQSGCTVVVATHDVEAVRRVRRRSALLQGGKLCSL